jgi:ankyrin repeat protein
VIHNATDPALIEMLLRPGTDVNTTGVDDFTPLIHAAWTDTVLFAVLLLEHGADVNGVSKSDHTTLTRALVQNSHDSMLEASCRVHLHEASYFSLPSPRVIEPTATRLCIGILS